MKMTNCCLVGSLACQRVKVPEVNRAGRKADLNREVEVGERNETERERPQLVPDLEADLGNETPPRI